jgi:hypothetical protein
LKKHQRYQFSFKHLLQLLQSFKHLLQLLQTPAPILQTPTPTVPTAPTGQTKEELKAVEGAGLGSIKYTKLSGLIARSLQDFKLQFEASFPKDDMIKAIEAAHCTIVDNKVVFIGG